MVDFTFLPDFTGRPTYFTGGAQYLNQRSQTPQLYLTAAATQAAVERVGMLIANDIAIAALLIRPGPDGVLDPSPVRLLIGLAQKSSIAALIEDDTTLARAHGADGVHLTWSNDLDQRYRLARSELGADAIIGVSGGKSRHDAMVLGEAGADYVGFGVPAQVKDRESGAARRADLISWWAEIFETPCVAFDVTEADEALALARAGADFIATELPAAGRQDELLSSIVALSEAAHSASIVVGG